MIKKLVLILSLAVIYCQGAIAVQTYNTDVVVVGGGLSGLTSAISAIDAGAKVILIEKLPALGGGGNYFEGGFGGDSNFRKRNNLITPTPDETFQFFVNFHHWRIDPILLRTIINESGAAMDYIETKGHTWPYDQRGRPERMFLLTDMGQGLSKCSGVISLKMAV